MSSAPTSALSQIAEWSREHPKESAAIDEKYSLPPPASTPSPPADTKVHGAEKYLLSSTSGWLNAAKEAVGAGAEADKAIGAARKFLSRVLGADPVIPSYQKAEYSTNPKQQQQYQKYFIEQSPTTNPAKQGGGVSSSLHKAEHWIDTKQQQIKQLYTPNAATNVIEGAESLTPYLMPLGAGSAVFVFDNAHQAREVARRRGLGDADQNRAARTAAMLTIGTLALGGKLAKGGIGGVAPTVTRKIAAHAVGGGLIGAGASSIPQISAGETPNPKDVLLNTGLGAAMGGTGAAIPEAVNVIRNRGLLKPSEPVINGKNFQANPNGTISEIPATDLQVAQESLKGVNKFLNNPDAVKEAGVTSSDMNQTIQKAMADGANSSTIADLAKTRDKLFENESKALKELHQQLVYQYPIPEDFAEYPTTASSPEGISRRYASPIGAAYGRTRAEEAAPDYVGATGKIEYPRAPEVPEDISRGLMAPLGIDFRPKARETAPPEYAKAISSRAMGGKETKPNISSSIGKAPPPRRPIATEKAGNGVEEAETPEQSPDPTIRAAHTPDGPNFNPETEAEFKQGTPDKNGFYPKQKEYFLDELKKARAGELDSKIKLKGTGEAFSEGWGNHGYEIMTPANTIKIRVPGDGTFDIANTKEAIETVMKKVAGPKAFKEYQLGGNQNVIKTEAGAVPQSVVPESGAREKGPAVRGEGSAQDGSSSGGKSGEQPNKKIEIGGQNEKNQAAQVGKADLQANEGSPQTSDKGANATDEEANGADVATLRAAVIHKGKILQADYGKSHVSIADRHRIPEKERKDFRNLPRGFLNTKTGAVEDSVQALRSFRKNEPEAAKRWSQLPGKNMKTQLESTDYYRAVDGADATLSEIKKAKFVDENGEPNVQDFLEAYDNRPEELVGATQREFAEDLWCKR